MFEPTGNICGLLFERSKRQQLKSVNIFYWVIGYENFKKISYRCKIDGQYILCTDFDSEQ